MSRDLPPGWKWSTIGEAADTQLGKTLSPAARSGINPQPYLRNMNVRWHRLDLADIKEMDFTERELIKYELRPGDLLVCEGGEVGRCALWLRGRGQMYFQNALHRLRPRPGVSAEWIMHYFRWAASTGLLGSETSGVTIRHLNQPMLRGLLIPLPPLEEQNKIVEAIEDRLQGFKAVEAAVTTSLAKLETFRRSVLYTAFTGNLVKPIGVAVTSDPSTGLPHDWKWSTLGKVARWGSGGTPRRSVKAYYGGHIPWAVIGDLNDGVVQRCASSITSARIKASSAKLLRPGTILVAMYGSIGKLGTSGIILATNQAIAHAVSKINRPYLFFYLMSQRTGLISAGKGATQKNISQTILKVWPIPLAPKCEQERIAEAIKERIVCVEAAEQSLKAAQHKIATARASILTAAFSGRLVAA